MYMKANMENLIMRAESLKQGRKVARAHRAQAVARNDV